MRTDTTQRAASRKLRQKSSATTSKEL